MPSLRSLSCRGPLSESDVRAIGQIASLEYLHLSGSGVTDEGMNALGHLVQLQELSIAATAVTDQSVAVLTRLRHLRRLDLCDTQISQAVTARLRKQLPNCTIVTTTNGRCTTERLGNCSPDGCASAHAFGEKSAHRQGIWSDTCTIRHLGAGTLQWIA